MQTLRRAFPLLPAAGALVVAGLAACDRVGSTARPSVILVSIDTLRADHLGLYGYERDTTPFLDRFAEECLVFERAFTPCSWTLMAHMTMLTGLLPAEHGITRDGLALSAELPLLAERLRDAGLQTVGLYYSGWIHENYGFARGFDIFRAHANAAEADSHLHEALRGLDRERPYFLFLHLFDVHSAPFDERNRTIYVAPPPYDSCFLPLPSKPLPEPPLEQVWESDGTLLTPEQIETLVAHYDGAIRYVDAMLEAWLGELERDGWLDNALVIVTADHGEALGQRGSKLDGHGGFFQEGLHVPLLLRHPQGRRAGERTDTPVHLADIVPTILEIAELPVPSLLGGRSLFGELPQDRVLAGSRRPSHAYVVQWPKKLERRGKKGTFIVDLEADPLEEQVAPVSEAEFVRLQAAALGARGPYPPPVPAEGLSTEQLENLRALGYVGEEEEESTE